MRNRILSSLLALLLAMGLVACTSQEETTTEHPLDPAPAQTVEPQMETQEQTEESEEEAEMDPIPDVTIQMAIISEQRDDWRLADEEGLACYAVTDLNQNGRLELISSVTQGTGLYSYNTIWEINETGDGLELCQRDGDEYESQADMVQEQVEVYYDGTVYHYIMTDLLRDGMATYYTSIKAVSLVDGILFDTAIATQQVELDGEGNETVTFSRLGEEITEEEYTNVIATYFGEMEQMEANILWFTSDDITDWTLQEVDWISDVVASRIDASYGSFAIQ